MELVFAALTVLMFSVKRYHMFRTEVVKKQTIVCREKAVRQRGGCMAHVRVQKLRQPFTVDYYVNNIVIQFF